MEKRQCLRTQYPCRLFIDHPKLGKHTVICDDISETGVFVRFDRETGIAIGERLSVQVVSGLPGTKTLMTQVVRADKEGLGLKFIA